jgi:catechol 2,3-dioxygenase-like lactoylglutathione lyase family enzyme
MDVGGMSVGGFLRGGGMPTVWFRCFVSDLDAAVEFYTRHLGFAVDMRPGPGFAALSRDALQLLLNTPDGSGGAAQAMPDGRRPEPGGWNRIQLRTATFDADVEALRRAGVRFRGDVIQGNGGRQVLIEDPSGNPVELFEPMARAPRQGG